MPAKLRPVAEMLAELDEALSVTKIREVRLRGTGDWEILHGLADFGRHTIYIDPVPAIVSTLVHEAVHMRWPSWSERRVTQEADRVFAAMTPDDIDRWWRWYRKTRRVLRRPVNAEP